MDYEVLIIGAGAAGLTAGIYAARAGAKTVIIEKLYEGGQIINTHEVENYPAFTRISGYDLAMKFAEHAKSAGANIIYENITSVNLDGDMKRVTLGSGKVIEAKSVIIATGAKPRKLGLKGEDEYTGRGVSYCATCDGAFYKGKTAAVIGGGNTAVGDAKYLARFAKKVYLIHRRDSLRAGQAEIKALEECKNVEFIWNCVAEELVAENGNISALIVKNVKTGQMHTISLDGIFVAVGSAPESDLFDVDKENGYIITDENMRTNKPGVFAAGDIRRKALRQIVTACADGAIAGEAASKSE